MSDRLDTSLQKLKRETVLKVSPSRKRRLKRHMRSKKVTTTRKDQLQHESNLKHINSTFHQLVQFTSLNSVLNHIISYMLSPSIGTVMHLSHCLNDCDPYGILSRESKQASEPMIWILKTLEYYLSDAYVASNYTFQKLFNIRSCYDEAGDTDQYSQLPWNNVIQTIITSLRKYSLEDSITYTNSIFDDVVTSLNDVLTAKDWNTILSHNNFLDQNIMGVNNRKVNSESNRDIKGRNISFYANNFLWLPVNVFLQLGEFKKIGTSSQEIVRACQYSKTLRVGRFPPSDSYRCAESILRFISSNNWDRSVLGRHNCSFMMCQDLLDPKIASKTISHQSTCVTTENQIEQCEDGPICLKTAINRLLNSLNASTRHNGLLPVDNTIGEWYIGRPWPTGHYFNLLQKQLHQRILFIDNLPLECSPKVIELFFEKQQIPVKHVSLPRFCNSKKNKGFAFVECSCHSHVQRGIYLLHGKPARTLYTSGDEALRKFTPRNSRPLFCCSHAEWLLLKAKRKNVDSLGCLRQEKTNRSVLDKRVSSNWVAIEPIEHSVSPLELMQFIQHSVVPLKVYFPPHSSKALVELSSEQDAHYLCFDILICKRSLGGSYTTTARITSKPLKLCEWNA